MRSTNRTRSSGERVSETHATWFEQNCQYCSFRGASVRYFQTSMSRNHRMLSERYVVPAVTSRFTR